MCLLQKHPLLLPTLFSHFSHKENQSCFEYNTDLLISFTLSAFLAVVSSLISRLFASFSYIYLKKIEDLCSKFKKGQKFTVLAS